MPDDFLLRAIKYSVTGYEVTGNTCSHLVTPKAEALDKCASVAPVGRSQPRYNPNKAGTPGQGERVPPKGGPPRSAALFTYTPVLGSATLMVLRLCKITPTGPFHNSEYLEKAGGAQQLSYVVHQVRQRKPYAQIGLCAASVPDGEVQTHLDTTSQTAGL